MARCSCGGSSCSCLIIEGAGISVTGAGSTTSPYVIEASGDFEGSIIAVSTDTLQLTTSGEGTSTNPLQITGRATVEMTDLLDVQDAVPPAEGEVPVWTVDHWEFKIPAAAPPGTVNRGAGLLGDGSAGNPLLAAISGIWGSGSMAGFPADTTLGIPVYTDSLGQLRARPIPVVRHAAPPITPLPGWTTITPGGFWATWGSLVYISGYIRRTGATIPSSSNGNIADVGVGSLLPEIPRPMANTALPSWGGTAHQSALTSGGNFVLGGLPPNVALAGGPSGNYLAYTACYIANTGVVL
jgi:hypothetical protein